jgi:hypothetical protein
LRSSSSPASSICDNDSVGVVEPRALDSGVARMQKDGAIATAEAAAAWTFGLSAEEYNPIRES